MEDIALGSTWMIAALKETMGWKIGSEREVGFDGEKGISVRNRASIDCPWETAGLGLFGMTGIQSKTRHQQERYFPMSCWHCQRGICYINTDAESIGCPWDTGMDILGSFIKWFSWAWRIQREYSIYDYYRTALADFHYSTATKGLIRGDMATLLMGFRSSGD